MEEKHLKLDTVRFINSSIITDIIMNINNDVLFAINFLTMMLLPVGIIITVIGIFSRKKRKYTAIRYSEGEDKIG